MMTDDTPDRVLIEDERPEGGMVHVTDAARLPNYRPDFGNWYLLETPARLHAEELLEALERIKANTEWAEEGREKAMVADHCHVIAREALARIEREKQ